MPQRVNIQYSIEIGELPEAVHALIQKSTESLNKNIGPAHTIYVGDVLSLSTLERIDELRLSMANADHILEDVVSIIKGYLHHKSAPAASPQAQVSPLEEISDLQRRLSDFKMESIEDEASEISDQKQQ